MSMIFKFKNVMLSGVKHHKLAEMSGVRSKEELPLEYINSGLRIYAHGEDIILHHPDSHYHKLKIGTEYTVDQSVKMLRDIATAGKRLTEINKKIKEEARNWEGKEWVVKI